MRIIDSYQKYLLRATFWHNISVHSLSKYFKLYSPLSMATLASPSCFLEAKLTHRQSNVVLRYSHFGKARSSYRWRNLSMLMPNFSVGSIARRMCTDVLEWMNMSRTFLTCWSWRDFKLIMSASLRTIGTTDSIFLRATNETRRIFSEQIN